MPVTPYNYIYRGWSALHGVPFHLKGVRGLPCLNFRDSPCWQVSCVASVFWSWARARASPAWLRRCSAHRLLPAGIAGL